MSSTYTNTGTYTVIDIRKTFEGFAADFRMIARRTEKMDVEEVESFIHDILAWAEAKYLSHVDITLLNQSNNPVRAVRYKVDENGKATNSDRAGSNDWGNLPNTRLTVIVANNISWNGLSEEQQSKFMIDNNFEVSWGPSEIDTSYSHLSKEDAQLYASKGYEVKKENFK